jgi:hypothetical protein
MHPVRARARLALAAAIVASLSGAGWAAPTIPLAPRATPAASPAAAVPDVPRPPAVTVPERGPMGIAVPNVGARSAPYPQAWRALWRVHHERLEFDLRGQLAVRGEVLAINPTEVALQRAAGLGFVPREPENHDELGLRVVVLRVPAGMTLKQALRQLNELDPGGQYEANHIYLPAGVVAGVVTALPTAGEAADAQVAGSMVVGLIDGGVAPDHPAFAEVVLRRHGCDGAVAASDHGTAVASLLSAAARGTAVSDPLTLYTADIYCGDPAAAAAQRLVSAIGWMVRARVPVINVSLVGPSNALLERSIAAAIRQGHLVVAAVGNDGPRAAPLFPAAYPGVVSVTGVDRQLKVLVEAVRGTHVDFAAPGAGIQAAALPAGARAVRGTSFAAPAVAGLLARRLRTPDPAAASDALAHLIAAATDLGKPGRDATYGHGCVGCVAPAPKASDRLRPAAP